MLFQSKQFNDDITKIAPNDLPDMDILCAGFPCQPFSQAGHKRGFSEAKDDRGNMFFVIKDIIQAKRPKALFLENVRHLLKHDDGQTFNTILSILNHELGYDVYYKVVKASDYGLPQHRPRVFIIGFDKQLGLPKDFQFPEPLPLKYTISDIFGGACSKDVGFTLRVGGRGSGIHDRRNWEFYSVDDQVVRLGITEGKMMMGLPASFEFPVSETQAMKQLGNSVAVDAVKVVGQSLLNHLERHHTTPVLVLKQGEQAFTLDYQAVHQYA